MKKLFALLIMFFYLFTANLCYAFEEIYYLNNTGVDTISNTLKNVFAEKDYSIQKTNPYYAISNKNKENYVVIVLQPDGQNLYYYIEANEDGKKFNKAVLKELKQQNISYQEYKNTTHLDYFSKVAQKTITGESNTYSFSSPQTSQQPKKTTLSNSKVLHGTVKKLGKGSILNVYLQHAINTATANVGDNIIAVLKSNWIEDSMLIAPQGSVLYGNLTEAEHAKIGLRNGSVQIDFNKLVTPDGKTYNLVTQKVDFDVTNEGKVKSSITKVATATALGALAGLAWTLLTGDNMGAGAAIGAGIAGGVALVSTVAAKGVDAEIPSYTELEVIIDEDIKAVVNY